MCQHLFLLVFLTQGLHGISSPWNNTSVVFEQLYVRTWSVLDDKIMCLFFLEIHPPHKVGCFFLPENICFLWGIGIFFSFYLRLERHREMSIGQFFHQKYTKENHQLPSKYTYRLSWKYLFADFLQPDFASAFSSPSCWGPELAPGWDWGWWWWWWWWCRLVYFKTRQNGQVFKRENIAILYNSMCKTTMKTQTSP